VTGFCPYCGEYREIQIINRIEETVVKSASVSAPAIFSLCEQCGSEFADGDQMDQSLKNAYTAYRKMADIVTPDEIISIRNQYGISQKAYAKLLGLGELTINSFEHGSIPSKSISNLIRLTSQKKNFMELFEKNKDKLSPFQVSKIESKLHNVRSNFMAVDLDCYSEAAEPNSTYERADWEKLIAMLQLILFEAAKPLYKMAVLKIAFYVDFTFYKRYGVSISGWRYAAINHGPVPNEWKSIIRVAEEAGSISFEPDDNELGDLFYVPEKNEIEEIKSHFTKDELQVIAEVTRKLKDNSATQLRNMTHEEDAWKKTSHASLIDYKHADTLTEF